MIMAAAVAAPKVLMIGDSISIGYHHAVYASLPNAIVVRPGENCRSTAYAVGRIQDWLLDTHWDAVHFNFGLHDIWQSIPAGPHLVEIDEYAANLETIVGAIRPMATEIVFATTTPVPDGTPNRSNDDVLEYNLIAVQLMEHLGVRVDDLYRFVAESPDAHLWQREHDAHFTPAGFAALGDNVAQCIGFRLAEQNPPNMPVANIPALACAFALTGIAALLLTGRQP